MTGKADDDPADNDRTRITPAPGTGSQPRAADAQDRTRLSDPPPATTKASSSPVPSQSDEDDRTRISGAPRRSIRGLETDPRAITNPDSLVPQAQLASRMVEPGVLINNNYRIQRMLSAGGMGEVYKAENVFTGDPVAVKIVLPSLASDDGIIQLFKREARILGQLNDSAIVRYHNFVLDQGLGRYCLIMEYIDGNTLWDQVDNFGPIGTFPALHLITRLAQGLGKAHQRGVTHRDLSPDNVMLRGNRIEDAVLIDFGIARAVDFGEGTLAGRFAGKFKYVSPEQLGHYGGEIGPAADIYGMALMIAAILRGTALDMGSSAVEAVEARRGIPDLSGLPHEIFPLLQHMLEPDPNARPGSMQDVAAMAGDPTRIPVRYRMPMWGRRGQGPERLVTGSLGGHTTSHAIEPTSDSPFGPVPQPDLAATPAAGPQLPRRLPMLAAAGAGAVLVLGLATWGLLAGGDGPAVPDDPADPDQTTAVAPVLPARDEATREGFLAAYQLGDCTQVQRIVSGMDAGKLAVLSDKPAVDDAALLDAYNQHFTTRPAVIASQITPAQCPALAFVRDLQGRAEPPPVLSLDAASLPAGGTVAGRIREAQGRTIWLFLVASDGGLHDLSSRLTPQADGSFTFSFGMALADQPQAQPQLVVALASRNPLIAPTVAPAGAPAGPILDQAHAEIAEAGGFAAADIGYFQIAPATP